jgi:hypothetical protein
MEKITVIKAKIREDMWDYNTNKPIKDNIPIGYVMDTDGIIPEGFIKYVPNKIFDKRKYPELCALFGKDHLPNELELKCYVQKHFHEWHNNNDDIDENMFVYMCMCTIGIIIAGCLLYMLLF